MKIGKWISLIKNKYSFIIAILVCSLVPGNDSCKSYSTPELRSGKVLGVEDEVRPSKFVSLLKSVIEQDSKVEMSHCQINSDRKSAWSISSQNNFRSKLCSAVLLH